MLAVAAIVPLHNMALFWSVLTVFAIFHATHDIACDGFYLQALDKHDQALYSGVRIAAFRGAMIIGSSVLVVLAGRTSWVLGFGAAGVLMIVVGLVNGVVMPRLSEPRGGDGDAASAEAGTGAGASAARPGAAHHRRPPPIQAFWAAFSSFVTQPQAGLVLSFMLFYKLGDIMMFAMSKPLLRDIGVDTAHRGVLNGLGTGATILGSVLGGALIARKGIERCLAPMTFFQNMAIPLYLMMAIVRPSFWGVVPVVLFEQFAAGVGAAAHVVFLMQRCRKAFSASHYALATAVVSVASTVSGYLSGPLNEAVGHVWFFTIAFIASWPSLVLVLLVPKTPLEPAPETIAPRAG